MKGMLESEVNVFKSDWRLNPSLDCSAQRVRLERSYDFPQPPLCLLTSGQTSLHEPWHLMLSH